MSLNKSLWELKERGHAVLLKELLLFKHVYVRFWI